MPVCFALYLVTAGLPSMITRPAGGFPTIAGAVRRLIPTRTRQRKRRAGPRAKPGHFTDLKRFIDDFLTGF